MIWVTRLNGSEIVVNADLIETVESTPDTVLTLVDGKKYVVHEGAATVVERVQAYRASILALLEDARREDDAEASARSALHLVPRVDEEG